MTSTKGLSDRTLAFVLEWVGTYGSGTADEDDANTADRDTFVAWAKAEQARRAVESEVSKIVRQIKRDTGKDVTRTAARAALRDAMAKQAAKENP